jgi:hypothetical protein
VADRPAATPVIVVTDREYDRVLEATVDREWS